MISNYSQSLAFLLQSEGGFGDRPADPGNHLPDGRRGCTNLGVTQSAWEDYAGRRVSTQEMRILTRETVAPFYKNRYWDHCLCDSLPIGVDYLVFDLAVNAGVRRASKMLQECVGAYVDGVIGPETLRKVADADPRVLIKAFSDAKEAFYRSLPTFPTFGEGWLIRVETAEARANRMLVAN